MKKQSIWFISIALLIALIGILVMQFSYLREIISTREEQFDEAVRRSLYATQRELERQETLKYLEEYYTTDQRKFIEQLSHNSSTPFGFGGNTPDSLASGQFSLSPKHGHNSIRNIQRANQEMLMWQYIYQRDLMDDVILRIINQTSDKPIMERLDVDELRKCFDEEMESRGYHLDYRFCILDPDGLCAYKSVGYNQEDADKMGNYRQMLFPKTNVAPGMQMPSRVSNLIIYFPGRRSLLVNSGLHFMIPSFIFTGVMMFLFIFVIVVVFRQKKLSEIKNDFINNMTHEFKTPISSISLASQMLNDPAVTKSPDMIKHITGVIADETKRLRFQVEKVLQMSMFDRQKTNLKLQDIPVNAVIESACSTFRLKVEKAGGKIETHLDAEDDICMIDEMHFGNVIFNLMDNAYKYSREDVPLHLKLSTRNINDKKLEIRVQDNGIGIKKEDLKRIFEKFYRVPTGNLHNVKGFGLGLAYVWKIVKDHGGDIKVESVFGEGTTFIITINLLEE